MGRHGFSRLIWKEFHTQGSLWLALAIGALMLLSLQLLPTDAFRNLPGYPFYVALVMTACYAGASGAILFAGEREEKTDDWLRQLPMRPRTLIGAKFAWLLVSTLLFGAFAGSAGWSIFAFTGGRIGDETPMYIALFSRALASMMVWAVLFSLLFHRVLLALLTALIMEFAFSITIGNLPVSDLAKDSIFATVVLVVAIADVILAVRWLRGQPIRISKPVRRERVQTGAPAIQLHWLQSAAGRSSLLARMMSVLVWREARGAVPFLIWWGLTGILCVLVSRWFGLNHFYLVATPAICGLLTYIGDRRQRDFRFYVERGISPRLVWLSKQLVWGLTALVLVVSLYTFDAAWNRSVHDARTTPGDLRTWSAAHTIATTVKTPWLEPNQRPPLLWSEDLSVQRWFVWLAGLSLFGLGQLAAIWIPRAIIAAALVFILAPFVMLGLGGLVALDVPLSATAFPLAALLFAATLFTFGDCLLEHRTWRKRLTKIAWIAVPCLLLFVQIRSIRALPNLDDNPPVDVAGVESQPSDAAWTNEWKELLGELPAALRLLNQPQEEFVASPASRIAEQMSAVGTQLATRQTPLPPVIFLEETAAAPGNPLLIGEFSRRYADYQTNAGQHRQAWQTLLNAARISRFLSQQSISWAGWYSSLSSQNVVLDAMREWATDPDVPTDVLQTALRELQPLLQQPLFATSMLERRYVVMRQLLEQRGPAWEWAERDSAGQSQMLDAVVAAGTLTGDKARLRGLIDYATAAALDSNDSLLHFGAPDDQLNRSEEDARETFNFQLAHLAASTALVPRQLFSLDPYLEYYGEDHLLNALNMGRTQQNATLIVLALQVWHREHGHFPQHLSQLTERLLIDLPQDHLSRGAWGYAPEGLPAPLLASRKTVIPAGQPLLWSRGWIDGDIVYHAQSRNTGVGRTPPNRFLVMPFFRPTHDTSMGVNDSSGGEPRPDQIRFLLLGTD